MRPIPALIACAAAALALAACGSQELELSADHPDYSGAVLFSERCGGCHTMEVAGTQGSGNRSLRQQGPNLDDRKISREDALFAIRNGGFSGVIMPQNIVVGENAEAVAAFVAEFSGSNAEDR